MRCEHLRAEGLVSGADGISRLNHMDFYANAGEAVALIGLSGAGKSTLAEVLCGEATAGGRTWLDGQPATQERLAQNGALIRRGSRLLENLTVTDNLLALDCPSRLGVWRYSAAKQRHRCKELLARFALERWLDVPVGKIPAAVQHQLLLLGAVIRGKRFLALDHLSDGCTPREQALLANCLRLLCADGITVLYVTGHIDDVLRQMDRVTVVRDGRRAKELLRGAYAESTLYTYVYGYHAESAGHLVDRREEGAVLFSLDGCTIRANTFTAVHDTDGSTPLLLTRLRQCTKQKLAVLTADDLSNCWLPTLTVLDNLLLTIAPRVCGVTCHVRRSLLLALRRECASETGLTTQQLETPFSRLTRQERFRVLLYRERLRRPEIRIFDRITAGADFQDRESMTRLAGAILGTVFYLSSDYAELESFGVRILPLAGGRLQSNSNQ